MCQIGTINLFKHLSLWSIKRKIYTNTAITVSNIKLETIVFKLVKESHYIQINTRACKYIGTAIKCSYFVITLINNYLCNDEISYWNFYLFRNIPSWIISWSKSQYIKSDRKHFDCCSVQNGTVFVFPKRDSEKVPLFYGVEWYLL